MSAITQPAKFEKIANILMPSNKIATMYFLRGSDQVGVFDGDKLLAVRTRLDAEKAITRAQKENLRTEIIHYS